MEQDRFAPRIVIESSNEDVNNNWEIMNSNPSGDSKSARGRSVSFAQDNSIKIIEHDEYEETSRDDFDILPRRSQDISRPSVDIHLSRKSADSRLARDHFLNQRKEEKSSSILNVFGWKKKSKNKQKNGTESNNNNEESHQTLSTNNIRLKDSGSLAKEMSSQQLRDAMLSLQEKTVSFGFRDEARYQKSLEDMNLREMVEQHFVWNTVTVPTMNNTSNNTLNTNPYSKAPLSVQCAKSLKYLIRKGIPDTHRSQVWRTLLGCEEFSHHHPRFYSEVLSRVFGERVPETVLNVPTFGGVFSPEDHYLTPEGVSAAKRILCAFAMEYPSITYLPMLPDLVLMFLNVMPEGDCYISIYLLLKLFPKPAEESSSKKGTSLAHTDLTAHWRFVNNHPLYFEPGQKGVKLLIYNFQQFLGKHLKPISELMQKLGVQTETLAESWLLRVFVGTFPYQTALQFMDCFISEGTKAMYRVGLGLLKMIQKNYWPSVQKCTTSEEFIRVVQHIAAQTVNGESVMKFAYSVRMPQSHVTAAHKKNKAFMRESLNTTKTQVYYRPKIRTPSNIIKEEQFEILWSWLPSRYCIRDPVLLYSTDQQGFSMKNFLSVLEGQSPTLIILSTTKKEVFGAFASHPWKQEKNFFGDRECFLWRITPTPSKFGWVPGNTDYFMMVTPKYLSVGGGDGVGLWLDDEFWRGKTQKCTSFNNQPLTSDAREEFECSSVEVYGFD